MSSLAVALVHRAYAEEPATRALALALAADGHRVRVITGGRPGRRTDGGVSVLQVPSLPAAPLRLRKLGEDLVHLPAAALAVRSGGFDIVHAFSPPDALAAPAGAPVVLTFGAPVRRDGLADRRLRLAVLRRALARSSAVVASSEAVEASLMRWLGIRAERLDGADAAGHVALYRRLIAFRPAR